MTAVSTNGETSLVTSESVTRGHPDKLCDQVSDLVLDAFLKRDPDARVACETLAIAGKLVLAGEFRTKRRSTFLSVQSEVPDRVRSLLREIGYRSAELDLDPERCEIELHFNRQSPEIAAAVDSAPGVVGAGDQGIMFGYACDDTPELLPLPWVLATALTRTCSATVGLPGSPLRPDGKAQVTVVYRDGRPLAVRTVVVSCQHEPGIAVETVREYLADHVVVPAIPGKWRGDDCELLLNAAGRWTVGGPNGDTGLTGRKIVVDAYGGACPHGGGAFSGKDPSKVDRSGAYMARHLAKHVVAAGLASRCTVQLAYVIGQPEPVAVNVDHHRTSRVPASRIAAALRELFDLTPAGIIDALDLRRPRYLATARDGHFTGANAESYPWEKVPAVSDLLHAVARHASAEPLRQQAITKET